MVILTVKKGEDAKFLFDTPAGTNLSKLVDQLVKIYNSILRIDRLAMGKCVTPKELCVHPF